ncbi:hypothetical protein LXD69_13760 [Flavobacterium sediminilitoris]|uniref:Uncharacterized protein n=1 Tax=Flavobacterium sediminilitoris TaxID=2024526 RepID=A0ABY4HNL4_9FLAO|nr:MULTISPECIES: hypothetical protein [Flavobacterium]UOX33099.1 hypothetical protein LXD69_13760 [Flavobacterium sediminilitoris]
MSYSISNVTELADCDVLLTWAGKEKAELEFKRLFEERLTTKYGNTSIEVEAVLQGVIIEIAAIDTIINVLPEGSAKEEQIKNKVKLEYKKFLLENRKESYGTVALLQKELDLERIGKELEEVDAFIAIVTAHKATL